MDDLALGSACHCLSNRRKRRRSANEPRSFDRANRSMGTMAPPNQPPVVPEGRKALAGSGSVMSSFTFSRDLM